MFTLGDICRKGVRLSARTEAVVFEGARLTYAALDGRVDRLMTGSGGCRLKASPAAARLLSTSNRSIDRLRPEKAKEGP